MRHLVIALLLLLANSASANPPVASYLFPAGGQRGTTVSLRVGGLFLYQRCGFALEGGGVVASPELKSVPTLWFEGPMLPLPDSQRQEDYPRDMAGSVTIAGDALPGLRRGHVRTAEGVAGGLTFVIGDLPEIVEREVEGDPLPERVRFPVTINGRIFPRQDADLWTVELKKGTTITATIQAKSIGTPLDARLELLDAEERVLVEKTADGRDPSLRFTAPADGIYAIRVADSQVGGSPAHVYRLTITDGPRVDTVFPLGGRRGTKISVTALGQGLPTTPVEVALPADEGPVWLPLMLDGKPTNAILFDTDDLDEALPGAAVLSPPVVVNGRIDQGGTVQSWPLRLTKGKPILFEVRASALGSRLRSTLVLKDETGKAVAQGETSLTVTPATDGVYTLEVADRFKSRGGPNFGYRIRIAPPEVGFRLKLPAETLNIERGKVAKVRVQIDRLGGFAEPLALTVEGLPTGVTVAPAQAAKGAGTVELTLTAATDAVLGAATVRIVGSAGPVTRAVPLLLGVALAVPFKVVADYEMRWSARGSTHRRAYRIERNGFEGPLEIRLADRQARHLQGVTGPVLTIPPGQNAFEYPVQLAPGMEIGRTCRVCIMTIGTVKEGDREYEVSYSRAEQNDQIVTVVETGRLGVELGRPTIEAKAATTVEVPFTLTRGKELTAPVKVVLVVPPHVRGVQAEPVTLAIGRNTGTLKVTFAADTLGPFNLSPIVRAIHEDKVGTTLAEAALEIVSEPRR